MTPSRLCHNDPCALLTTLCSLCLFWILPIACIRYVGLEMKICHQHSLLSVLNSYSGFYGTSLMSIRSKLFLSCP